MKGFPGGGANLPTWLCDWVTRPGRWEKSQGFCGHGDDHASSLTEEELLSVLTTKVLICIHPALYLGEVRNEGGTKDLPGDISFVFSYFIFGQRKELTI